MARSPAIGIDLGTAYSCVGIFQNGQVKIIPNDRGNKSTPSCVAFTENVILVGDAAKEQATRNPRNTIFGAKRLLGRKFGESFANNDTNIIEEDAKHWPFEVINDGNKPKYRVKFNGGYETYFPEEISAMVLEKMKEIAEAYLGVPVERAVISVPAYFNNLQRKATIDAAAIANLDACLINEPTAAAIAYSLDRKAGEPIYALIFDLGAGTLDVTIANIIDKGIRVISTSGNTHLGGEDFDIRLMNHLAKEFQYEHEKNNLKQNPRAMHRLRTACEQTKITLSSAMRSNIEIDSLHENVNFSTQIFRTHFEKLNEHSFQKIHHSIEKALRDAGLDKSQIHEIILVGGSSRIPKIQEMLRTFFKVNYLKKLNNADEAVAYGAAVHAAITNGDLPVNVVQILDVTPLSFCLSNDKGEMREFIKRNANIPTEKTIIGEIASNVKQDFKVYEGECTEVEHNNCLAEISYAPVCPQLEDVAVTKIEVTFSVNANDILNVTLRVIDNWTESNNPIILHDKYCLNEYDKIGIREKKQKYKIEEEKGRSARNSLQMYCDNIKRSVQREKFKNAIYENDRNIILRKCNDTLEWLHSDSSAEKETCEQKQKELKTIMDLISATTISPDRRYEKYCEFFNVRVGATKDEIRTSFKRLARQYHPQNYEGDKDMSNWIFSKIVAIKDTLIDLAL